MGVWVCVDDGGSLDAKDSDNGDDDDDDEKSDDNDGDDTGV